MGTITIGGNSVYYREFGAPGAPLLILVHGLYSDSTSVIPLAERLGASFHVVAPDALGHGRSARPAAFTLQDQGRMLDDLAAALTPAAAGAAGDRHLTLVGISMGSYLAAQAAILAPEQVSQLVLVVGKAHGATSSTLAYARRMGIDLSSVTPEEMVVLMAGAVWSPSTPQQRRDEIMATQLDPSGGVDGVPVVLTAAERGAVDASLAGFDLRPGLASITARTLVISGRSDGLNPPESGGELAALIPGAGFEVYDNSGHMLVYEETDRFITDVTRFVLG